MSAATLWHYTVYLRWVDIAASGTLRPATALLGARERPVVWFSMNPVWEETANKSWQNRIGWRRLTRAETEVKGLGLVRIAVAPEVAPYTWEDFKRLSGIARSDSRRLEAVAREDGASLAEWRVSFEPVRREHWSSVERWVHTTWIPLTHEAVAG
jgi:hypothetical protein